MQKRETIFINNGRALEVDKDGNLYWNGNKLATERKVALAWWVNLAIIAAGLSAFGNLILQIFDRF